MTKEMDKDNPEGTAQVNKVDPDLMEKAKQMLSDMMISQDRDRIDYIKQVLQEVRDEVMDEGEKPIRIHEDSHKRVKDELEKERALADELRKALDELVIDCEANTNGRETDKWFESLRRANKVLESVRKAREGK